MPSAHLTDPAPCHRNRAHAIVNQERPAKNMAPKVSPTVRIRLARGHLGHINWLADRKRLYHLEGRRHRRHTVGERELSDRDAGGKVEERLHLGLVALVGLLWPRGVRAAALREAEPLEVVADHDLAFAEHFDALLRVGG